MHSLSPETDNCPSWISGRERMTVENISWSISTKECCQPRRGSNPRPPGLQSDAHPTAPPRPAYQELVCCVYSLELPHWGNSNGYIQQTIISGKHCRLTKCHILQHLIRVYIVRSVLIFRINKVSHKHWVVLWTGLNGLETEFSSTNPTKITVQDTSSVWLACKYIIMKLLKLQESCTKLTFTV